ncbi:hypothetical protein MSIBF_A900002 [groundwater metagenome]|uniref:Uncharacterized protein n=1 Tax=groundwater metagenome TaxID=717931 RepID=A0A098EDC8_9ZZZZ
MKNKKTCSAGVHERADKGFGQLSEDLGRSLVSGLVILGLIFGLSSVVSACDVFCSDCASCNSAISSASEGQRICLNTDIINHAGTCIDDPANFENKTFDCQGYIIDGIGWGRGIFLNGKSGNEIRDCIISNFLEGIGLWFSSFNIIDGNKVNNNSYTGIYLYFSSNNTINENKEVNSNVEGIWLLSSSSNNITGNKEVNSNFFHGILLDYYSNDNLIDNNIVNSNDLSGIKLGSSSGNVISNNIVNNNNNQTRKAGIYLEGSSSNTITQNQINNNWDGIYMFSSHNNIIYNNNIVGNRQNGIHLYASFSNTIDLRNTITNQLGFGVFECNPNSDNPNGDQIDITPILDPTGNTIIGNFGGNACEAAVPFLTYNSPYYPYRSRNNPPYQNWCLCQHVDFGPNGFNIRKGWDDVWPVLMENHSNFAFGINESGYVIDPLIPIWISNNTIKAVTYANYTIASNITANLSLAVFGYSCPLGYSCSITYTPKNGVPITPNCTHYPGGIMCYNLPIEISNESNLLEINCNPPKEVPSFNSIGILILIISVLLFGIVSIKKKHK